MAPPPLTVADALVAALHELGVRSVFGVSGANIEHLHDAIHRHRGVRSVLARREDGAAYMADCHARVHRTLGVCCATSGGGMMNLIAGVAESYAESVPVLAIVGQPTTALQGRGAFQDASGVGRAIDGASMWRAVAKYVGLIGSGDDLWPVLTEAVYCALADRKGPSVVLVARDVYDQPVLPKPVGWLADLHHRLAPRPPTVDALDALMSVLAGARRPVALMGQGVRRSSDPAAVVELLRDLQMPVATTMSARADFPNDDPLYLGTVGAAGHPSAHRYLERQADVILAVGTSLDLMTRGPVAGALAAKTLAVINIDPSDVMRLGLDVAAVVDADAGLACRLLRGRLDCADGGRPMWGPADVPRERFRPRLAAPLPPEPGASRASGVPSGRLRQSEALALLEPHFPAGGHLVLDAGNCAAAALHLTDVPAGTSSTIAFGMGAMGYAIPGAVGAAIGPPGVGTSGRGTPQPTVVCAGDGAFLMLGFEIHVAVDLQLPILFVIFNNNMHGMCATRQQLFFDSRIEAVRYVPLDVAQVARGLGPPERLWVAAAATAAELAAALDDYRGHGAGPGVLELRLGAEEVPPFTPLLPADEPTF
jgi:acetolactate synthase-1/2/3 large subunit